MRLRLFKQFWVVLLFPALLVGLLYGDSQKEKDRKLILQLGNRRYDLREDAGEQLLKRGEELLSDLRHAADNHPDPEIRKRAHKLVYKIVRAAGKSKSTDVQLLPIPPGEFLMGSPANESGRRTDEPPHRVRITKLFLMAKHEVTQAQFTSMMGFSPSDFAKTGDEKNKVKGMNTAAFAVENVSWYDAVEFCNRLSTKDGYKPYYKIANAQHTGKSITKADVSIVGGHGYRLPTEAEWEYACRGHTTTPFSYGKKSTGKESNIKATVSSGGYGSSPRWRDLKRTTTVGSYPPNGWGLQDMHGNVVEWCQDWYDQTYYQKSPVKDPTGPKEGAQKVARGGSWLVNERSARSASRLMLTPSIRTYYAGFRVARTP